MTIMVSPETKHLVELLQKLEKVEDLPNDTSVWLRDEDTLVSETTDALLTEIVSAADAALITSDGKCRFDQHEMLKQVGFRVGPGETDSFGWLSGIIYTGKGKVVFG